MLQSCNVLISLSSCIAKLWYFYKTLCNDSSPLHILRKISFSHFPPFFIREICGVTNLLQFSDKIGCNSIVKLLPLFFETDFFFIVKYIINFQFHHKNMTISSFSLVSYFSFKFLWWLVFSLFDFQKSQCFKSFSFQILSVSGVGNDPICQSFQN